MAFAPMWSALAALSTVVAATIGVEIRGPKAVSKDSNFEVFCYE